MMSDFNIQETLNRVKELKNKAKEDEENNWLQHHIKQVETKTIERRRSQNRL